MFETEKAVLFDSLLGKGISERVVCAMRKVTRESFLSKELKPYAYEDKALPISEGQTISQPYTVAYMTDLLDIQGEDEILEVGTGSGYQTAVLWQLCRNIHTVERIYELSIKAETVLSEMEVYPDFVVSDGTVGYEKYAPYSKILVTAGARTIPVELVNQLSPNGKLVIPVGDRSYQTMTLVEKNALSKVTIREYDKFKFVPLIGVKGW
jgi:protein-L-isoaspartate(D-aspartate) O-methyltransferase